MRVSDLDDVVRHGLCAGCGLCESMAGSASVEMGLTSFGQIRPRSKEPLDEKLLSDILAVCPGLHVRGPVPEEGIGLDPVFGPIASLHRVWASDEEIRFRAAAGGSLTAFGRHLLKSGEVEAVLHVAASATQPELTDARISRTPDEVTAGSQSRPSRTARSCSCIAR